MRNRVLGLIGVLWGGLITVNGLSQPNQAPTGDTAYVIGTYAGLLFGILMFCSGLYYLITGDKGWRKKIKKKRKSAIRTPV